MPNYPALALICCALIAILSCFAATLFHSNRSLRTNTQKLSRSINKSENCDYPIDQITFFRTNANV